jgi:hypothetical protein
VTCFISSLGQSCCPRGLEGALQSAVGNSCTFSRSPFRDIVVPLCRRGAIRRSARLDVRKVASPVVDRSPMHDSTRPLPVIQSARRSPRQRPVSEYSCHRPTAARMGLFSKAGAHGLAALIDPRCRRYVCSSISRTGTADPELPVTRQNCWRQSRHRRSVAGRQPDEA